MAVGVEPEDVGGVVDGPGPSLSVLAVDVHGFGVGEALGHPVELERSDLSPELCLVGDGVVGFVVDLQHRPGRVVGLEHAHVVVAGVVVAAPGYWVMVVAVV